LDDRAFNRSSRFCRRRCAIRLSGGGAQKSFGQTQAARSRIGEVNGVRPLKNFGTRLSVGALALSLAAFSSAAHADQPVIQLSLKNHRFEPAEINADANKPLTLEVANQDPTPAEFESKNLRVEKVVPGNSKITVQVRPLPPGRYRFFDDYHEATTEGFLTVK
jgi:hypothetical protein